MTRGISSLLLLPMTRGISCLLFLLATAVCTAAAQDGEAPPEVYMIPPDGLAAARARLESGDAALQPALDALLAEAERALDSGHFSVVHKTKVPPSGDKHDYTSYGPYWWPDPSKPDGLPYIRRDGQVNPESRTDATDRPRFGRLSDAVETLALAYYFTREERFAEHAAHLLRFWYLDPETRMNPHLQYGQAIPGRTEGRGIGIIDTRHIGATADAATLLQPSKAWTEKDQDGLTQWFADYLDWLHTSAHGIDEQRYFNNHGTWYDVQTAALALATGQEDVAEAILSNSRRWRVDPQIEADGSQPHELARTRPLAYSTMNLQGLFHLAVMGERVELDLWNYEPENGGGLKDALDFLVKAYRHPEEYRRPDVASFELERALPILLLGREAWGDPRYDDILDRMPEKARASGRAQLFYAQPR